MESDEFLPQMRITDAPQDYFDLDAILACAPTVPMKLDERTPPTIFPLFGHNAPASIGPRGIRVDIPLWMAPAIVEGQLGVAQYPTGYNQNYQSVLNCNPESTPISDINHYYYTFGSSLCRILPLDLATPLSASVLNTWVQRAGGFVSRPLQGQTKIDGATQEELVVFQKGVKAKEKFDNWRRDVKVKGSNKRKLAAYNR
ncbi:unnamed protein product, partial [Mesorhabditis spiculigera]